MKRIIASLAAVGVLVAGGLAVSMISGDTALAQVAPQPTESDDATGPREAALDEVMSGLVADGVITQEQADAVKEALQAKGEELRAERQERRAERKAQRELIRSFLEDDVIDANELAQLGDDHPLNDPDGPAAPYLDDGQLTKDELRELRAEHGRFRGPRGAENSDNADAQDASI